MKRLLVLALLCPVAAACGGSSHLSPSAYREKLATIAQQADTAQHNVEQALQAKTVTGIHARLSTFAAADGRLGGEIDGLKPPKNAQHANSALAKAERDMARTVRLLLPRVAQAKSVKAALELLLRDQHAAKAGRELDAALTRLKKLGYAKEG